MDDGEWNAFNNAQAEEVKHTQKLPDICNEEVTIAQRVITCKKTHMRGELEHEAFINDDNTKLVRITWT